MKKRFLTFILMAIAGFSAAQSHDFIPGKILNNYPHINPKHLIAADSIRVDSMNLAIFDVDFITYKLNSVSLTNYKKCDDGCDKDSLPIRYYFDNYWDYAHVYFNYKYDNSSLFRGGVTWMGTGQIEYPTNFRPADLFPLTNSHIQLPANAEWYNTTIAGYYGWDNYKLRGDSAWKAIDSLQIVHDLTTREYRVGLYGYPRAEGLFVPEAASWIIFLYRGNNNTESITDHKSDRLTVYPNPSDGRFYVKTENFEIYNVMGQLLHQGKTNHGYVDMGFLPTGIYLLRYNKGSVRFGIVH